ncbi:hypothetical protein BO70DRAFT_418124 [Aspergillus heteromorphus CBS 117.55]|uniref:Uncharacterized protein n=1 Tax=Aspergillus heteromorphus CBS 117.55 TaxID=1448321 RepID=A0A317WTJ1_9EURO|nr:uncharacterized protein BO70DRAFT_418124 [Aspergillus heteromorphus CBS 117.55]PWY89121.1 hypothetical protein BO70DRAFT_418124 [Aspergillus heteromorphus CBS 117.55]
MVNRKRKAVALRLAETPRPNLSEAGSARVAAAGAKRKEQERVMAEQSHMSMARFWASKAESLGSPFQSPKASREAREAREAGSIASQLEPGATLKQAPASASKLPYCEGVDRSLMIPHDAIAKFLRETQHDCPKAQAWLKAHEMTKMMMKGKLPAGIEGREDLRKQLLSNLRFRTLVALKSANASKDEVREVLSKFPPAEEKTDEPDDDKENQDDPSYDEPSAQFQRVVAAHEKLQNAMAWYEEWLKSGCHASEHQEE